MTGLSDFSLVVQVSFSFPLARCVGLFAHVGDESAPFRRRAGMLTSECRQPRVDANGNPGCPVGLASCFVVSSRSGLPLCVAPPLRFVFVLGVTNCIISILLAFHSHSSEMHWVFNPIDVACFQSTSYWGHMKVAFVGSLPVDPTMG